MILPSELLDVANSLFNYGIRNVNDEAKYRSIINRAYYAAFLTARDNAGITSKRDVHKAVIDYYINAGNFCVSNKLSSMRNHRRKSDYDLNSPITLQDVRDVLRDSKQLIMSFT